MIVEVDPGAPADAIDDVRRRLATHPDVVAWCIDFGERRFVLVSGDESLVPQVGEHACVRGHYSTNERGYWLVDRAHEVLPPTVQVGDGEVGADAMWFAAGPCALESFDDAVKTGQEVASQGAHAFRVGVYKPRSGPYNFPGKGRAGLAMLPDLREATGLPVITEVLDPRDVEPAAEVADCLQVGTRNMTNQALLKEIGLARRPVVLKRGIRSPVVEWLRAAEFVASNGNGEVILCARGIASFDTSLRSMPDIAAVAEARRHTQLPVIFDPSHSAGRRDAVARVALAAAAFGADGLLIECHVEPSRMYRPGDGDQAYDPVMLGELMNACESVRATAAALDKRAL
jgi:3-deoxy-7-phosphoheptulonate synthase